MKKLLFITIFTLSALAHNLPFHSDVEGSIEVMQREYAEINIHVSRYIQTYGLASCVALLIYEPETTRTVLAHIDAMTDLKQLEKFRNLLETGELFLIAGDLESSRKLMLKIEQKLKALGGLNAILIENDSGQTGNILFDLKEGKLYEYEEVYLSTSFAVREAKKKRLKFGKRLYRHEQSLGGGDRVHVDDINLEELRFLLEGL